MASTIATILALSSLALAHPRKHHHPSGWSIGTGTGGGFAQPTGHIPFPANGTDGMGAGSPTGSAPVLSVTVQPTPVEAASSGFSSVPDFGVEASSVSLTSTASVSAGQFYGRPSGSYSHGGWGSSSSAVIPTTFATVSAGSSAASASVSVPAFSASASAPAFSASASAPAFSASASMPAYSASASAVASSAWASSAPASASTSVPTTGGSSGGKKGLSYNTASLLSAFSGDGMSWAYNWGAGPDGTLPSGVEYVPMCWGLQSVSAWGAAAAKAIAAGSTHVLSFNEPDLGAQSNMDPATAAKNHIQYMNPLSGSAQIGSPAITNGAGSSPLMGLDWMEKFFESCNGQCKVDFIAFHWYAEASNFPYFKQHVEDVVAFAQSKGVGKVWLTEYGASGSDADVASFISQSTAYLDGNGAVERYAYFMASDGILVSGNGLSTLGKAYAG